jgi:hypothetical protein
MTHAHQLVDFFARTEFINIAVARYALRATLHSDFGCAGIVNDDSIIFGLIGATICWSQSDVDAIWADLEVTHRSSPLPPRRDVTTLFDLQAQGHAPTLSACQQHALTQWRNDPVQFKQLLRESSALLECERLVNVGSPRNLSAALSLYGLTDIEVKILEIAVFSNQRADFRRFLTHFPLANLQDVWGTLLAMTGATMEELRFALKPRSKLRRAGLVAVDLAPDNLEEFIRIGPMGFSLFHESHSAEDDIRSALLTTTSKPELTKADFPHLTKEIDWIVQSFKNTSGLRTAPMHILLRGPSGSGKSQLAKVLLHEAGLSGFSIQKLALSRKLELEPPERLERLDWTDSLLELHPLAAIVVEGIDELATASEALLIDALERSSIPTIWITDSSKPLRDCILRHFMYHLELRRPSAAVRSFTAAKILADAALDARGIDTLLSSQDTSPAQLRMAAKFAGLSCAGCMASSGEALSAALEAGQRARGLSLVSSVDAMNGAHWDLDALNLEVSAPLPRILSALQRTGCGSLAFHGIPGTGKTSLANHIASVLDRPLLAKRVSDLSSKWIGETEKCIADMFQEATAENAVLLLDEGDSFLRDRRLAKSPWEVTQVNELLQQMESHKGIFICATNLIDDIDPAALRRFTFKVKFLPLDDLRRTKMFTACALPVPGADIPQEIQARLQALDHLAPGDFATVRRQEQLIGEKFNMDGWITELEREHALRTRGSKRRAAFV